jgi:AcrR family transcriptional regulator
MPRNEQAQRVLDTALRLFDLMGYSATTIKDIKLQSEVSVGTIYHYFGNKEGIAGALYVDSLAAWRRGLAQALARSSAEDGVRAAVGHHLSWCDANRARARFLLRRRETEVADLIRADIDGLNRLTFETIELWYRPHVTAGELRDLPLPLLYAVWFGPAQEYARVELEHGAVEPGARRSLPSLADAAPALADAAWAALRPG